MNKLICGDLTLDLSRPLIMGVLNVTPDSFSDGGRYDHVEAALGRAREMVGQGADLLDVGGESTRPGATAVSVEEELTRVIPVIEAIREANVSVPISIDTSKPEVMQAAVQAGACMVNDVMALRSPGAVKTVRDLGVAVCLMHMQGEPRSMQRNPQYHDVVQEVYDFLAERVTICEQAGISRDHLVVDPGFGFGKTVEQNYTLLKHLHRFTDMQLPLLVGISRKSMIGAVTEQPVEQRVAGSLAAAVVALVGGANIVRVHDVATMRDARAVYMATRDAV